MVYFLQRLRCAEVEDRNWTFPWRNENLSLEISYGLRILIYLPQQLDA
jgi:hypothetical protein